MNTIGWYNLVALLLIGSMIITASVWRARRLVRQQVATKEARGNLSRYFSPNVVEQLSAMPGDLDIAQSQNVAILYGEVVVGNVGAERRLEFTLMRDPVNVTSRLERQTREHDTPIAASDDLIGQVWREHIDTAGLIDDFSDLAMLEIRGRRGSIRAWRSEPQPDNE